MLKASTDLALIQPDNLPAVFASTEKVDEVLERIATAARAHVPDLSTVGGRKAVASVANKVARSKTALDDAGSSLVAEKRRDIQAVDAERRRIRTFLDDLKAEVRAPLTKWEADEEARVASLAARLHEIEPQENPFGDTAASLHAEIVRIFAIAIDDTWQERLGEAAQRKDAALADLRAKMAAAEKREAEQEELARLRADAAAREKAEREAAEAKFRAEMEAAAEEERARRAAQVERDREEAAAKAAEAARVQAEREAAVKVEAAQRAQREAEEREQRAIETERRRAAEERRREEEAEKRRAADAATRARVRREIISALTGKTPDQIADLIIAGRVPHIRLVV